MIKHLLTISLLLLSGQQMQSEKPTLFVVGDSTVKNGSGRGEGGLWGWGDFLTEQFDTTRLAIRNYALGGRSSRTFITQGLWADVLDKIKPGDFVIMQFGHNDASKINDDSRARGTIKGTGEETEEIDNLLTGKHEVVHSYGWYMRKYIRDTKAKDATPIVCSLVARNVWENGKVVRASDGYALWAATVAKEEGAFFIDLNDLVAAAYEKIGEKEVSRGLFLEDHTHTTEAGARLNATLVATGLRGIPDCSLNQYLK